MKEWMDEWDKRILLARYNREHTTCIQCCGEPSCDNIALGANALWFPLSTLLCIIVSLKVAPQGAVMLSLFVITAFIGACMVFWMVRSTVLANGYVEHKRSVTKTKLIWLSLLYLALALSVFVCCVLLTYAIQGYMFYANSKLAVDISVSDADKAISDGVIRLYFKNGETILDKQRCFKDILNNEADGDVDASTPNGTLPNTLVTFEYYCVVPVVPSKGSWDGVTVPMWYASRTTSYVDNEEVTKGMFGAFPKYGVAANPDDVEMYQSAAELAKTDFKLKPTSNAPIIRFKDPDQRLRAHKQTAITSGSVGIAVFVLYLATSLVCLVRARKARQDPYGL
eukprot:GILJ01003363.1.p1 GENE.GILJ01003363.1~~GILJ01003363.1.p1  ORF type:complete len:339 (+),score=32.42 GILJ01003363.1:120-1136(+)